MVRVCVFPKCGNKMKKYLCVSWHRLPLYDPDTLKSWLVVLQLDVETPPFLLLEKDYRVCSEHFDEDDFMESSNKPRRRLKKHAIPKVKTPTAGKDEVQDDGGTMDSLGQLGSTGVCASEDCPDAEKKQTLHIVDEEAILQLMNNCPMCNKKCRCRKRTCGPYFIVYQSCYFCSYQRKWASQPEAANMNTYKARKTVKRKLKQKDKVCENAETPLQP